MRTLLNSSNEYTQFSLEVIIEDYLLNPSCRKVPKRNKSDDGIAPSSSTSIILGQLLCANSCTTTHMGIEGQSSDQVNAFLNELKEQQCQEAPTCV